MSATSNTLETQRRVAGRVADCPAARVAIDPEPGRQTADPAADPGGGRHTAPASGLQTAHPTAAHRTTAPGPAAWTVSYLRQTGLVDCACAMAAGALAAQVRFDGLVRLPLGYLGFMGALPALWWVAMLLAGGYDIRFIGLGSEEFRRVIKAAVSLIAVAAIVAYAADLQLASGYLAIALPSAAALDLAARYCLRKRLYRMRSRGCCTRRVVAVGHAAAVADLVTTLRRDSHHGLSVVATCLAETSGADQVADIPVAGRLTNITAAVGRFGADTVAVLACPEMDGARLRELACSWRRRAPTCAWRPRCCTWQARGPPSARWPGCRCCTSTTRNWPGPSRPLRARSTVCRPRRRCCCWRRCSRSSPS
jgi:hypothetical protein